MNFYLQFFIYILLAVLIHFFFSVSSSLFSFLLGSWIVGFDFFLLNEHFKGLVTSSLGQKHERAGRNISTVLTAARLIIIAGFIIFFLATLPIELYFFIAGLIISLFVIVIFKILSYFSL